MVNRRREQIPESILGAPRPVRPAQAKILSAQLQAEISRAFAEDAVVAPGRRTYSITPSAEDCQRFERRAKEAGMTVNQYHRLVIRAAGAPLPKPPKPKRKGAAPDCFDYH